MEFDQKMTLDYVIKLIAIAESKVYLKQRVSFESLDVQPIDIGFADDTYELYARYVTCNDGNVMMTHDDGTRDDIGKPRWIFSFEYEDNKEDHGNHVGSIQSLFGTMREDDHGTFNPDCLSPSIVTLYEVLDDKEDDTNVFVPVAVNSFLDIAPKDMDEEAYMEAIYDTTTETSQYFLPKIVKEFDNVMRESKFKKTPTIFS